MAKPAQQQQPESEALEEQILKKLERSSRPISPAQAVTGLDGRRQAERILRDMVLRGEVVLTDDWLVSARKK